MHQAASVLATVHRDADRCSGEETEAIAKLICHGDDRDEAIDALLTAVEEMEVWPIRINVGFLARALDSEGFRAATLDTGFIADRGDALIPGAEPDEWLWDVAAQLVVEDDREDALSGFRLNTAPLRKVTLWHGGVARRVDLDDGQAISADAGHDAGAENGTVALATGCVAGDDVIVFDKGTAHRFVHRFRGTGAAALGDGAVLAPMPGKVIAVDVAAGDHVTAGQRLMVLEAMKMEHALTAAFAALSPN